ncbi:MAG: NADH-quinone oxidoreductase subunit D [Coprobacter sp.]|jgi:NADH-quinone oxidoreductase subunit C/D|nr:NADH-quinone oxidoreductase subunit D [Barnesiella sp. GGCC_0306]MBS7040169.1 NADH-quinone oxidoreductase subunit D [Bacteroidales bacterium]PWM90939.1 MAG: NADH-quinone oxidoreductase subunit D [Coprobacter sp.]
MANIQEKISNFLPEATFVEGQILEAVIPAKDWQRVARFLRNDEELQFDYLVSLIGMDWGETLGCVYYFDSTVHHHQVSVKVETSDKENPLIYSVSDIWAVAYLYEREVFDFYGIRFINHPDMRRLFLRNDWVGYPLRKDYDINPEVNPVRLENEEADDTAPSIVETADGKLEERVNRIFASEEFVVNIGPQHPATHGVLRLRTSLEGENVKKIDVYCGYIHRGIEKLCESLTYPQTLHFADRLDYLSAQQNRHAICLCVEDALQIEVPMRAQYIRTMMDELMRISSHLLFYATFCMDLGGTTAFFYGFRDREKILDIMEDTCGARMTFNYNVIGGVMADLHPDFQRKVKEFCQIMPKMLKEYHQLFTGNVIAQQRMKGIGILSREEAISRGMTGPSGRASGWACDIRKLYPYGVYDKVEFNEVLRTEGDVFARYMVRMDEIVESIHILEQLVDNIPEGDYAVKMKPVIKLPEGHYFRQVEASRGAMGVYIESRGEKYPYRLKLNSPCFPLVGGLDSMCRGGKIADLIAIGGSLDYVIPDIDR